MGKGKGLGTVAAVSAVSAATLAGVGVVTKQLDEKHYILKDAKLLMGLTRLGVQIQHHMLTKWTVASGLEEAAAKFNEKDAIVFESEAYTFRDWNEHANQAARYFHSLGVRKHDVVAIYMTNRPEFIFAWTGLAKIGAVGALINHNLKHKPLLHCLKVAGAKHLFFGIECIENLSDSFEELQSLGYKLHAEGCSKEELATADTCTMRFQGFSKAQTPTSWRSGVGFDDNCLLIYTSGTTGMPKPAILKHAKIFGAGAAFGVQFNIRPTDRIYNSGLPLYHSAATNIGGGLCLTIGCTLIIRSKFSASSFWEDCERYRCTVVQYIGELCRYLLATPPSPKDKAHNVRLAVGNGLRPEIWGEFQSRFNIPEIGEFFGSSEGNVALFNHCVDKASQGAVGHMGLLMRQLGFCTILKFDPETEMPVRDPVTGFCIEAADGEAGEAVAEIKNRPAGTFDGYYGDEEQSKKKILTNVFRKGDRYFRSGDLLMKDKRGYYYFMDRIGDTFRWKAENVSTTEVAGIVGGVPGVKEVSVYGVQLPGKDGRACCAACVVDDQEFDVDVLRQVCQDQLPSYAIPLFLRFTKQMDTTGTFKVQKVRMREEGVDPTKVSDPLYFLDVSQSNKYTPLTTNLYNSILNGASKL